MILCFGLSYSDLLLHIYGGDNLTAGGGTNLLRWDFAYTSTFLCARNSMIEIKILELVTEFRMFYSMVILIELERK
jgi:hypothetical protein